MGEDVKAALDASSAALKISELLHLIGDTKTSVFEKSMHIWFWFCNFKREREEKGEEAAQRWSTKVLNWQVDDSWRPWRDEESSEEERVTDEEEGDEDDEDDEDSEIGEDADEGDNVRDSKAFGKFFNRYLVNQGYEASDESEDEEENSDREDVM